MRDAFIEDPQRLSVIRRIDSHWTPYGAWRKFSIILNSLGFKTEEDFDFGRVAYFPGDLGNAYEYSNFREQMNFPSIAQFRHLEEKLECLERNQPENDGHVGSRFVWKNEGSHTNLRVVAFGNSFFERGSDAACLSWWAARWFREFHFIWNAEVDYEYVDLVRPDVVICQKIERFLPRVPLA